MLLKCFHFRFEDVGFEERNCGILQDVSCASIQVAASPRERLDKILETVSSMWKQEITFGPMTQQIRNPGRRKILVRPLMITTGS